MPGLPVRTWPGLPGVLGTCRLCGRRARIRRSNWQEAGTVTPFRWLALWPLVGAALKENFLAEAFTYAGMLLDPTQQLQPQTIREWLDSAFNAWQNGHTAIRN